MFCNADSSAYYAMDKIVFDNIVFSLQKFGGISTYWYELASRLVNDTDFDASFIAEPNKNVFGSKLSFPKTENRGQLTLPLMPERFINPGLKHIHTPFVFHSSYNRYCVNTMALNVTTVHDLIHHKYYTGFRRWIHNTQKGKALVNSKAIIAISENTKRDILEFFPKLDPEIISVVYNGVSNDFFKINETGYHYEMPEHLIRENYLLYVSSRESYKNFNFVIDLLKKLPDFKIYIVGPALTENEISFLDQTISNQWKSFTGITVKALNELYNHAYSLLYPSSYEGFGIPLLEAMKAFCPFIALNSSSIPEVAGDAGILMNEPDVNAFIKAIESIQDRRNDLQVKGNIQVSRFSWDKCYLETAAIYKKLSVA